MVPELTALRNPSVLPYMQRRSRLLSHSCLRRVEPCRCCRCGSLRREEGGEKLVRMASPAAPSLNAPLAPCAVLKPVLQFFGLV